MACATCKFYCAKQGECRAHPPTITDSENEGIWPTVSSEDWCGEWQSKTSKLNSFGNEVR